jgi:hypothetical protein
LSSSPSELSSSAEGSSISSSAWKSASSCGYSVMIRYRWVGLVACQVNNGSLVKRNWKLKKLTWSSSSVSPIGRANSDCKSSSIVSSYQEYTVFIIHWERVEVPGNMIWEINYSKLVCETL